MNTMRKCICGWRRVVLAVALVVFVAPGYALFAQTAPIPERLSPDTVFYVHWRGKAFLGDAEKKNHLLQLLEDPDFAPLGLLLETGLRGMQKQGQTSPADLADIASLLDNPAAAGVVAIPVSLKASPPDPASFAGFFLVYDATGKEGLIQKLRAYTQARAAGAFAVATYDFGGTSVEVRGTGPSASYTAQAASYYLFSNRKQVIEDLITRFRGPQAPVTSVTRLPDYQAIREYIGPGAAIESFARVPDLNKWFPPDQKEKPAAHFLQSLHLEKIRAAGGGISFTGETTHFRGAILGDTSSPSLFDLAAPRSAAFLTQPVIGASPSFSVSRLRLGAIYQLVRGGVENLPDQQAANFMAMENMAQNFLGMPIGDALGLFSGEIATASSYSDDGSSQLLLALTIQKPDDVLRVLRAIVGPMVIAEDSSGRTTYLDLSYPYKDPLTGTRRRSFYYVAVTPQMVLAAPRKAILHQAIERLGSQPGTTPSGGIFANPEYVQMRSLLPEKLSGLSASDMAQIPWDKMFANYINQLDQATKQSNNGHPPNVGWLTLIKPAAISRHLHMAVSGWWKDPNGVYLDSNVQ